MLTKQQMIKFEAPHEPINHTTKGQNVSISYHNRKLKKTENKNKT